MSLRYTGPNGDYPVYCCRFDRDQRGDALCQEVRALPVDAFVERVLLDASSRIKLPSRSPPWGSWRRRPAARAAMDASPRARPLRNREGFVAARGCAFKGENVWLLRTRWKIPTIKINGASANPMRWQDGSFSIQGVAAELGVTSQTVFDYLARGHLAGHQLTKGQPWQIDLSDEQIDRLRARLRRTKRSRKEAS